MKINGFLKDVQGAARVTEARRELIASSSPENLYADHIRDIARELHPAATHVVVTQVEDVSPTARRLTLAPCDGDVLPPFQAGQYVSLDLKVGRTLTSRPYSISSAPFEARCGQSSMIQITVRDGKRGENFAANWLYGLVRPGDRFVAHLPFGDFFYEPLRDAEHVVALAGGSGITPFVSMAREISHGTLDCDLTILYGSTSSHDIICKEELDELSHSCDRIHVAYVISGEEEELPGDCQRGLLSADLIMLHSHGMPSEGNTSYFVCGPLAMYRYVLGELDTLGVPERRIRTEVFGSPRDPRLNEDYSGPSGMVTYRLTVHRGIDEQVIPARSTEPIAVALERAAIPNHTRCRSGACGYCRCKLLSGEVYIPEQGDGRRAADKKFGYIHACSAWPLGDCAVEVPII